MKKMDIAKNATQTGLAQIAVPIVQLLAMEVAMEVDYA